MIHAPVHVELAPNVTLLIILPLVLAQQVTQVILSHIASLNHKKVNQLKVILATLHLVDLTLVAKMVFAVVYLSIKEILIEVVGLNVF